MGPSLPEWDDSDVFGTLPARFGNEAGPVDRYEPRDARPAGWRSGPGGTGAGAGPGVEERYDAATEAFFAAENDAAAANKKRIVSQAAFDEVVNENIEDFEMEPEEALADAIEQFEKQGVDLCLTQLF